MAQIGLFGVDKIGTLSESSGTITMQASVLTIGGQQYNETSALTVAATLAAKNTRYQIYAVRSGGNTILVVSSNENSVGPAGYTAWKLVGSYYANGASTPAFGSFVNITGIPKSEKTFYVQETSGGTLTGGTNASWRRDGEKIIATFDQGMTMSGSGILQFGATQDFPIANIGRDFAKETASAPLGFGHLGMSGVGVFDCISWGWEVMELLLLLKTTLLHQMLMLFLIEADLPMLHK